MEQLQVNNQHRSNQPPALSKPWEIQPPANQAKFELSGSDNFLQGQKLPQVFKQQAKNISKIHEGKQQIKQ